MSFSTLGLSDALLDRMRRADGQEAAAAEGIAIAREIAATLRQSVQGVLVSTQSGDIDALYTRAPQMEKAIAQLPGLKDGNTDLDIKEISERLGFAEQSALSRRARTWMWRRWRRACSPGPTAR